MRYFSPLRAEPFITALRRANKTMIKTGILWLLFLSSCSRGRWGEANAMRPCDALCPGPACWLLLCPLPLKSCVPGKSRSGKQRAAWEVRPRFPDSTFLLGETAPQVRCLWMAGTWMWKAGAFCFSQVSC